MKLVIVESPSKAKSIQKYLDKDYIVLASYGHITDLAKGGKHGMGININENFKPHYVLSDDKVEVLDKIMQAVKKCDMIYLCSDPDREGTAISWHLQERLKDFNKPFKRAMFREITKNAVLKALKEAGDIDMNVVHAQEARRILDRLVGFTASPFLINCIGPNLSSGRVQSVLSRMIVDREKEIEDFKPEDYWTIQVALEKDNHKFFAKFPAIIKNEEKANEMHKRLDKQNYIVSNVVSGLEYSKPMPPLVTSTLQRVMSKNHGFAPERTMKAAQSLYENSMCTYIRTDSVRTSEDSITNVREYLVKKGYGVPDVPNEHLNKDAAQDAHECIRPTDVNILSDNGFGIQNEDEALVYSVIWKYFVASQMKPAVYDYLKVFLNVEDDEEAKVVASGKALKEKGYTEIFGTSNSSKIDIPNLEKLDKVLKKSIKLDKKATQPPPRFSEDKLIKELVSRNIGRPATFADLLSKVTARNYVEKVNNIYYPTELGKKITNILIEHFTFMNYNYTAEMESKLDKIENGNINHIDMLKEFYINYKKELEKAYISKGTALCENCKFPMVTMENKKTKEKFTSCSNYLNCKYTKSLENVSVN